MISVPGPLPEIHVEQQHATEWWVYRRAYEIVVIIDGIRHVLKIPAGFRYNRSSIPRVVTWLTLMWITKDDLGCHAPGPHDGFYRCKGLPAAAALDRDRENLPFELEAPWGEELTIVCTPWRKFAKAEVDLIFYLMMQLDEVNPTKALWSWRAVKWFGRW